MAQNDTITVSTSVGEIIGRFADDRYEFKGIPYAEAPVGALRFAAPVRRAPFEEPFSALEWGSTPQKVPLFDDTLIPEPTVEGDDILNLNVFSPRLGSGAEQLPVLFWIHGGGYRAGSAIGEWFHGKSLNREGVVVVSVSYRLAVDGFMAVKGAASNRGLRDLIMALEWVHENIAAFGGDPQRVTISGQSAGGGAVLALAASPLATDLFQQVWSMSGVLHGFSAASAVAKGQEFAASFGVEATVAALSPFSDAELQQMLAERNPIGDGSLSRGPADDSMGVAPVIGDDVLPMSIGKGLERFSAQKKIVVGATAQEFFAPWEPTMEREAYRELVATWGVDDAFADAYVAGLGDDELTGGRLSTDVLFRAAVAAVMRIRAEGPGKTWAYDFRWIPPVLGVAGHCADVPFFFNVADSAHSVRKLGESPAALVTSMHRDFVDFIRLGAPGWEHVVSAHGPVRVYDEDLSVEHDAFDAVQGFASVWVGSGPA